MKTQKEQKKKILFISFIVFAAVLVILSMLLFRMWPYLFGVERYTIFANATISPDKVGFEILKDANVLTFGIIKASGTATREIMISNNYEFPLIAKISSSGSINYGLEYEKNILIGAGEEKRIPFTFRTNLTSTLGYYEGYVKIKLVPAS